MHGSDDARNATAVFTHFRNRMFTGHISQSNDFTVGDYETCAEQLELDERQKLTYFVSVLRTPRAFFYSFFKKDMDSRPLSRTSQEYHAKSRPLHVMSTLDTLKLTKFM